MPTDDERAAAAALAGGAISAALLETLMEKNLLRRTEARALPPNDLPPGGRFLRHARRPGRPGRHHPHAGGKVLGARLDQDRFPAVGFVARRAGTLRSANYRRHPCKATRNQATGRTKNRAAAANLQAWALLFAVNTGEIQGIYRWTAPLW